MKTNEHRLSALALIAALAVTACGSDHEDDDKPASGKKNDDKPAHVADAGSADASAADPESTPNYVLGSVVIDADGNRTTYVQVIHSLDDGPFDNKTAIELPGNGVVMAGGKHFYVGLTEEPTWVRYEVVDGKIKETGRLSFLDTGAAAIDYGNAIVDADTAVSVFSDPPVAVVWNPTTMKLKGEVDLGKLARDGYELEVWTTTSHDGLVYIPGRWADWEGGRILPKVSTTILDPKAMKVVGTAEDDRCASGGRVVFDADGYAYVMGDGRNYSIQMFANASGDKAPDNCLLRIAPGATDFEEDYFYKIPALTGGLQSITELETAKQGSGVAFAKMFYPNKLPDGVEAVDFDFWDLPVHKMWRIELADPPTAKEVKGIPFSTIGFEGSVMNGLLYTGESKDPSESQVYETDPDTNTAKLRFKMDGYFNGLYQLDPSEVDARAERSDAREPLYALMTQVYGTNDDRTVYISMSHTLDIDDVDLDAAREFPGVANLAAIDGRFMVSSGQEPSITEYAISDDLKWTEGKTLSFAGYPLEDNANFYYHYFVDAHTAYLPFEVSKRIVWDPTAMKITGVLEDSKLELKSGTLDLASGGNRNGIHYEGPVLQPFEYHDEDWLDFGTKSFAAVYDPETGKETEVIELPCAGLSMTTQDENGYTYFGTWSYLGTRALYGVGPKPCMVRLKPDLTIDDDWTTDFTDVTDGHYVNNFRYIGHGKAIGNVLLHEKLGADFSKPYDPDVDSKVWESGPQWQFWMFDVEEHAGWAVKGIKEAIGSGAQFSILDGRTFVFLPFDSWSKTAVYEIDGNGKATRRFEVTGDVFKWIRVR